MVRDSRAIISFNRRIADLGIWRFDESKKSSGLTRFIGRYVKAKFHGRDCVWRRPYGGWPWLLGSGHAVHYGLGWLGLIEFKMR